MKIHENDLYFVHDPLWKISITDGYNSVLYCGLYDYIKNNEIKSYVYDTPIERKEQFDQLYYLADLRAGHSGSSYGITMRIVEKIIKYGFNIWKIDYIKKNRNDIMKSVIYLQKHIRKVLSNPMYLLCRRRLKYEFELLI